MSFQARQSCKNKKRKYAHVYKSKIEIYVQAIFVVIETMVIPIGEHY
jgi:hypothetical protein